MVSFSCENCGDILTKKKLDAHRAQCRGASFTCLDCLTHFRGTEYKSHTSCISEAQKYQGALYKDKPTKTSKKSPAIPDPISLAPRKAYVEDAPDPDTGNTLSVVESVPKAPSPPIPTQPQAVAPPVNVFDFLVTDDTPNASKVSLGGSKEQMKLAEHAPTIFRRTDAELEGNPEYQANGYSYGADPVLATNNKYQTPASKYDHPQRHPHPDAVPELDAQARQSTDKKRKRHELEELKLNAVEIKPRHHRDRDRDRDELMSDAPAILHTGLTGGLTRLLKPKPFPPSPDYSRNEPTPLDPVKRSRHTKSEKERGATGTSSSALVRTHKVSSSRRTSDESSRPRKKRSSHRHSTHSASPHRSSRKLRAIEYHPQGSSSAAGRERGKDALQHQQLVVYRTRAELFMSYVNKGPESEHGCSMNKALKRYHRERGDQGLGLGKGEEEKELWKALRLRRNERGEVVVFF